MLFRRKFLITIFMLFFSQILLASVSSEQLNNNQNFNSDYKLANTLLDDMSIRIFEGGINRKELDFFKSQLFVLMKVFNRYKQDSEENIALWKAKESHFEMSQLDGTIANMKKGIELFSLVKEHISKSKFRIIKIDDMLVRIDDVLNDILNRRVKVSDRMLFTSVGQFYNYHMWSLAINDIYKHVAELKVDIESVTLKNENIPGTGSWFFIFILYLLSLKWLGHQWEKIARYIHKINSKMDLTHIYQINRILLKGVIPSVFLYLIVSSITNPVENDYNNIVLAFIISIASSLSFSILVYISITAFFRYSQNIMRFNVFLFSIFVFCILFNNNINAFMLSTQFYPFFGMYGVSMINLILSIIMLLWGSILLHKLYTNLKKSEKINIYYCVILAFLQFVITASPLVIFIGYSNLAIGFFINVLQTAFMLYYSYLIYRISINTVYLISLYLHVFYQKNISTSEHSKKLKTLHPYLIYWLNFLIGFFFVVGAGAWLALCWGMTPDSLSGLFKAILFDPVPIGDNTTFTLYRLISAILVLLVCYCVIMIISGLIDRQILKHTSASQGTKYAIKMTIRYFGMAISLAVFIYALGVDSKTMTFVISGLSIGVGFALKDTLSNFISGIIVLVSRHVRVGDWIYTVGGDIQGTIQHIGLHSCTIMQFDNRPIVVPNSIINSKSVINASRMTNRRILQYIGIRYQDASCINLIIQSVKKMLLEHPAIDQATTTLVNLVNGNTDMGSVVEGCFGSYSINLQIYTYTKTVNWVEFQDVQDEIMLKINQIIIGHGAKISFPTSNVELKLNRKPSFTEGTR